MSIKVRLIFYIFLFLSISQFCYSSNIQNYITFYGQIKKSSFLKEDSILTRLQIYIKNDKLYNFKSVSRIRLKSVNSDFFEFRLFFSMNKTLQDVLKKANSNKSVLYLSIQGYATEYLDIYPSMIVTRDNEYYVKYHDASNEYYFQFNRIFKPEPACAPKDEFKVTPELIEKLKKEKGPIEALQEIDRLRMEYEFKRNISSDFIKGTVFNIKENKYYYLGRMNNFIEIFFFDKAEQLGGANIFPKNVNINVKELYLRYNGDLALKGDNKRVVVKNNKLQLIEDNNLIMNYPDKFDKNFIYYFGDEVINKGAWMVPYVELCGKKHVVKPNEKFTYKVKFDYKVIKKNDCKETISVEPRQFYSETSFKVDYLANTNVDYIDVVRNDFKKLLESYYQEEQRNIKQAYQICRGSCCAQTKSLATKIEIKKGKIKEFINDCELPDDFDYSNERMYGEDQIGTFKNPFSFGLFLNNGKLVNEKEGPYSEVIFCDKDGKRKAFKIFQTGWNEFLSKKGEDFQIVVTKNGFKDGVENLHLKLDKAKSLEITGYVRDVRGNPIVGALVEIHSKVVKTDSNGFYRVILPFSKGEKEYTVSQDFVLKPSSGNLEVKVVYDNLFPNGKEQEIKIMLFNNGKLITDTKVNIIRLWDFRDKNGASFAKSQFPKGYFYNLNSKFENLSVGNSGVLTVKLKIPKFDNKLVNEKIFPITAKLYICEPKSDLCGNGEVILSDPIPHVHLKLPGGMEEEMWQTVPSVITINDGDSKNFNILIKGIGYFKTIGKETIRRGSLSLNTDKNRIEFYYKPEKFGFDLHEEPEVLREFLLATLSVLADVEGAGLDKKLEGIIKAKDASNFGKFKKMLELHGSNSAVYMGKATNAGYAIYSGLKGFSLENQSLPQKIATITDTAYGAVDIGYTLLNISTPEGLSFMLAKGIYNYLKATNNIIKKYRKVINAYQDYLYAPIVVYVTDDTGYTAKKRGAILIKIWVAGNE